MGHFNKGPSKSPIRKVLRLIVKAGRQQDTGKEYWSPPEELKFHRGDRWLLEGEHNGFWTLMDRWAAPITCYRKKPQTLPPCAHLCILALGASHEEHTDKADGNMERGIQTPQLHQSSGMVSTFWKSPGTWDLGRMTLMVPSQEDLNKAQSRDLNSHLQVLGFHVRKLFYYKALMLFALSES